MRNHKSRWRSSKTWRAFLALTQLSNPNKAMVVWAASSRLVDHHSGKLWCAITINQHAMLIRLASM